MGVTMRNGLFAIICCVIILLLLILLHESSYVIQQSVHRMPIKSGVHLGPDNPQTTVNDVSLYIEEVLRHIKDPKKRLKERQSLAKYNDTRHEIIATLPRLTKQNSQTTFHVLVDNTEKLISRKYHLVVLILSYTVHWERRRTIRRLWGNHTTSIYKDWKVFFITGGVTTKRDMETLYREAMTQKDIIIVDFMENWQLNLGRKVMTGLQWATSNFMYDYILKTDDDVFVDIDSLLPILRKKYEYTNKDIYMGYLLSSNKVYRSGRYAIPVEEYAKDVLHPFCAGGGYILSRTLVKKIIPIFQWEHHLRLEDGYIGSLVLEVGGSCRNQPGFYIWNYNCQYNEALLLTTPAPPQCMEKLQRIFAEKKEKHLEAVHKWNFSLEASW